MTVINYTTGTLIGIAAIAPFCGAIKSAQTVAVCWNEDELAKRELARIMPRGHRLLEMAAARTTPLPAWFDEEEEAPF